ncbi:MAG TPA: pyruvate dehydrogenase (acetyl-transferring) E1 component subunit alpha [Moraxellaceae bacterium]|nr:pyruvate dehydrogenase (acetyl-transferring) E1 component subunit alpha [Moraxellaceae bacterium]
MAFIHDIAVDYPLLRLLDDDGRLAPATPTALRAPALWWQAYEHMLLTRRFDERAIHLQRTGRLGTYASCLGQEALSTAIGLALRPDDVLVPYYRDQAAQLLRGVAMADILRYWGGDERGSAGSGPREDMPACVPIATQLPHAAGIATAIKLRQQKRAVLVTCGDGATSRGDFYEALNLAGVWHLPLVIVINNNQWAISVPLSAQTACPTLAQKALAAGLPGVRVDGNDVLALQAVLGEALARARAGKGPTLVEGVTYRLCDHTTADDMSRYADPARREQARAHEPLLRLRALLEREGGWSAAREEALAQEHRARIDAAEADYLATPAPTPTDMFDYLFADPPEELQEQREAFLRRLAAGGGPGTMSSPPAPDPGAAVPVDGGPPACS